MEISLRKRRSHWKFDSPTKTGGHGLAGPSPLCGVDVKAMLCGYAACLSLPVWKMMLFFLEKDDDDDDADDDVCSLWCRCVFDHQRGYIYLSFILGRFVFLTFLQRGGKHMKPPT